MSENEQVKVDMVGDCYRAITAGGNVQVIYSPTSDGPQGLTGVALCQRVRQLEATLAAFEPSRRNTEDECVELMVQLDASQAEACRLEAQLAEARAAQAGMVTVEEVSKWVTWWLEDGSMDGYDVADPSNGILAWKRKQDGAEATKDATK